MQLSFHFEADLRYRYKNLSEAKRNRIHETPLSGPVLCDIQLPEGWYRFVGAAGTKMPTTRVPAFGCGTDWPDGWLVLILRRKLVKFTGRSAIAILTTVTYECKIKNMKKQNKTKTKKKQKNKHKN